MQDINTMLEKLHGLAMNDEILRKKLLDTQTAAEPMEEFCRTATENGCPIVLGDLLVLNETLWGNMLKSTNGGATYPMDDWADAYEMFISGIM